MRVPLSLSKAFGPEFESDLRDFVEKEGLLSDVIDPFSSRTLRRFFAPHIKKLSGQFNEGHFGNYWKTGKTPDHLRLAYFLYFMPCNLYRVAAVFSELERWGYSWEGGSSIRSIEWGAGPASATAGAITSVVHSNLGLPNRGEVQLVDQSEPILRLGGKWARFWSEKAQLGWKIRTLRRDYRGSFDLPLRGKRNLWLSSCFLSELDEPPKKTARQLFRFFESMHRESLIIMIEPALRTTTRRFLTIRKELLQMIEDSNLKILLPCFGHQACGALADPEDWCHEDVSWWRPPYIKELDRLCGLDRKSLPFSYLVLAKSSRSRQELLPSLPPGPHQRIVSPPYSLGKRTQAFYVCSTDRQPSKRRVRQPGKGRARIPQSAASSDADSPLNAIPPLNPDSPLERGDLFHEA